MAGGNFDPYTHQNNDLSTSAGANKFHRSASSSTDDAVYVAGNRARQEAARARNASNPSFGGLLSSILGGDPRARARSTFRNPQASQPGIFGYQGFLRPETGNTLTDLSRFTPFNLLTGAINYATTGPRDSGATYTMNTQGGTGTGVGGQQALANMQSRRLAANQRAEAAYGGDTPEPVKTSTLSQYSGLPAGMEAQYSTSPAPLLADPDIQLEAFTGQPSDPVYRPGGEFDAFVEMTMDFPDFDDVRDNRDLMIDVFQKYKAMNRGAN